MPNTWVEGLPKHPWLAKHIGFGSSGCLQHSVCDTHWLIDLTGWLIDLIFDTKSAHLCTNARHCRQARLEG